MADAPSGSDFGAMFALINASRQQGDGSGASPVLACILPGGARDVDVGTGLSCKGKGFNADKMAPTIVQTNGRPKLSDKLLSAVQRAAQELSDINRKSPIVLAGSIHAGANVSSGLAATGGSDISLS